MDDLSKDLVFLGGMDDLSKDLVFLGGTRIDLINLQLFQALSICQIKPNLKG